MRAIIIAAALAATAILSYGYGLISHRDRLPPYPQALWLRDRVFPERIGSADLTGREEVACRSLAGPGLAVVLTMGQSNAANHGENRYAARGPVYGWYRGRCFRASDPLPGATGDGGSAWGRFGDRAVAAGLATRVLVVPIGVGTTTMADWAPGGYLHRRVAATLRELAGAGVTVTHVFWHQGGSERRSRGDAANRAQYRAGLLALVASLRAAGVAAPVFVARSSIDAAATLSDDIRAAQADVVDPARGIHAGPDDDALTGANRFEVVHLSGAGLDRIADEWVAAVRRAVR